MKIAKVTFNNFRPYYKDVSVDLNVSGEQNIVLIGGRNGQGKTSFLLGLVWCLYGQNIDKVDDVFKNEVKGNYPRFLNKSLNWESVAEENYEFSVSVLFTNVELSEGIKKDQLLANVEVIRSYNTNDSAAGEKFEILIDGEKAGLIADDIEKANFVNDYLIPIDLAKFVFFDAEKIAEIAALGAKDQASIMDRAFGQVLGLNNYENLIDDLKEYERTIHKNSASADLVIQINSFETAKKNNEAKRIQINDRISSIEEDLAQSRSSLNDTTEQLIKRGDFSVKLDVDDLRKQREILLGRLGEVKAKFNEVVDYIPFAILAPKLQEVVVHLSKEEQQSKNLQQVEVLQEKTKELADKLFNRSPLPETDMDFETKTFYYNKAKSIISELYSDDLENDESLDFTHEFDRSEILHVNAVFELTAQYSKDAFESVFNEYIRLNNDFLEIDKELRKTEGLSQDEFIADLQARKAELEKKIQSLERECGAKEEELIKIDSDNKQSQMKIDNLLEKAKVSKQNEKQLKIVQKYIKAIAEFIVRQKAEKKAVLESTLLTELNRLLDKRDLVNKVDITILDNNLGMDIKLFDSTGRETNPNSDMSKGEQQLYISALLKAILSESIYDLPVFIDTPLGRLDQEHRNNILEHYYPELSEQVIILSTNSEIRSADLGKLEKYISKKYLIENKNKQSRIKLGYFEK
ncbi:MAG: DNA sulfur modification protein DndD [Flavipsychrobacter sp.]|nr:DNA sulfur modification protein DndD [Flavipsychrobacter sp.]